MQLHEHTVATEFQKRYWISCINFIALHYICSTAIKKKLCMQWGRLFGYKTIFIRDRSVNILSSPYISIWIYHLFPVGHRYILSLAHYSIRSSAINLCMCHLQYALIHSHSIKMEKIRNWSGRTTDTEQSLIGLCWIITLTIYVYYYNCAPVMPVCVYDGFCGKVKKKQMNRSA